MAVTQVTYHLPRGGRVREAFEEEQAAYRRRLEGVLAQADALEGAGIEKAVALVKDLQTQVLGELSKAESAGDYGVYWLNTFRGELSRLVTEMAGRYGREVGELLVPAWTLGQEMADAGFVGRIVTQALPRLTPQQLNIATEFSADLIRGIEDDAREKINQTVRTAVLTGKSPAQLGKELALKVTTKGSPFRSAAVRAEVIARTETARLQGLGAEHRMRQVARANPDLGMKMHLLVAEVNGWPCETCRAVYEQGPWDVDDPGRPMVPLHPLCRCKLVAFFPDFTELPDPNDGERSRGEVRVPTTAQRAASVTDTEAPPQES